MNKTYGILYELYERIEQMDSLGCHPSPASIKEFIKQQMEKEESMTPNCNADQHVSISSSTIHDPELSDTEFRLLCRILINPIITCPLDANLEAKRYEYPPERFGRLYRSLMRKGYETQLSKTPPPGKIT